MRRPILLPTVLNPPDSVCERSIRCLGKRKSLTGKRQASIARIQYADFSDVLPACRGCDSRVYTA